MKAIPTIAELHDSDQTIDENLVADVFDRFNVKFKEADDQSDVWADTHVKYDTELYYDGNLVYKTTYQAPKDAVVKIVDVWNCVLLDAMLYQHEADLASFLYGLGYNNDENSLRNGIKAYEGCKETFEALSKKGMDVPGANEFINFVEENGYDMEAEAEEME